MIPVLILIVIASLTRAAADAQDKWVWGSARNGKLAGLRPNGRYGVYEPDLPEEPYSPPVRPPPRDFPSLIRPSRPSFISENNYNRPSRPSFISENNYNRPSRPSYISENYNNDFNRPYPQPPPPREPGGYRPLPPPSKEINSDPTKFEKCKCTHSFNCKSPGISFGNCDVGKKYCCEKNIRPINRGPGYPVDDRSEPEVLAGPGGPVDHLLNKNRGSYGPSGLGSYGISEPRRP